ncbi:exported hypothetical protein [Verrucomicrobia bacterium]|nr:exported hypothetical protein [Verrucomicrobiota bacterium]
MKALVLLGSVLLAGGPPTAPAQPRPVFIGSKKFTESYVLAEIAKRTVAQAGLPAELRPGMGGTIILWEALREGAITCYPEYTGTLREVILHGQHAAGKESPADLQLLRQQLAPYGIGMTEELGFNNTYALVMLRARARALAIQQISDLRNHSQLVVGLSPEFLGASRWMESALCQIWVAHESGSIAGAHACLPGAGQRRNRSHRRLFHRFKNRPG